MQPLSPNQPSLRKFNLLLITIAAVSMIVSSCNKFPLPGGPVGNPTAVVCDIQDFNLAFHGTHYAANYGQFVYNVADEPSNGFGIILTTTTNIQYNNLEQPFLSKDIFDSVWNYDYDGQGRLAHVIQVSYSYNSDSLNVWKFGYKPGSVLPDSLYWADVPRNATGVFYSLEATYARDNNQRVTQINFPAAGGGMNYYHRYHYNPQGDLDTVYEYGAGFSGSKERPVLIVYSYDDDENLMLTNRTWTILSSQYSLHNPMGYILQTNNPDGSVASSQNFNVAYQYGGALDNLPVTVFTTPGAPGPTPGTITYACTIGGGVTPVTGGQ